MDTFDSSIEVGKKVLLTYQGTNMAVMTVTSKFTPDKPLECIKVLSHLPHLPSLVA
jgi:sulfate adenylyltransferase